GWRRMAIVAVEEHRVTRAGVGVPGRQAWTRPGRGIEMVEVVDRRLGPPRPAWIEITELGALRSDAIELRSGRAATWDDGRNDRRRAQRQFRGEDGTPEDPRSEEREKARDQKPSALAAQDGLQHNAGWGAGQ